MGRQMTEMLKGTLEGIVLAVLSGRPAYGYEITAWLRDNGFADIAEGTVYALLIRIEQRGYVENGAKVYVSSRKKQACDETAAELGKVGQCIALPGDISTEEGVKALAAQIAEREPKLDILVNNAGTNWGAPMADYNDDAFQKVLADQLAFYAAADAARSKTTA